MSAPDPHAALTEAVRAAFPNNARDAAQRFRAAAANAEDIPAHISAPDGDDLATQVAWFGRSDARHVQVLISGVHGVESYCGSGIQLDWLLTGGPGRLQDHEAVLLVHVLNPYGFAWDRRVTEEGYDLNRNFVDFGGHVPDNQDFVRLQPYLHPDAIDDETLAKNDTELARLRSELGERAFQIARKSGQYVDDKAAFFGGFAPSRARLRLESIVADHALHDRDLVTVIDVHTGLGPFGYGEPQDEHAPGSLSSQRCRRFFGPSVTSPDLGTSYSVPVYGSVGAYFSGAFEDGQIVYLCLEFGTFDQERSRRVLREDHWLFAHAADQADVALGRAIRERTRTHYFPGTFDWCEMVLMRGRQVIAQALGGMRDLGNTATKRP